MSKLLPSNHEQFRTRSYWDSFFKQRGNEAFEWYGSYDDVRHLVAQQIPNLSAKILTVGCGNSEFSHNMYDAGYLNIRNLDYSEVVIEEMRLKNANGRRSSMHWDVGDMTNMAIYKDDQFDVVCDKGALDALMSVDTADVRRKAQEMLSEIRRVLSPGGKYVCITLAESYILRELMCYFVDPVVLEADSPQRWLVQAETFRPSSVGPFCPVMLIFTKLKVASAPTAGSATSAVAAAGAGASSILCRIDAAGKATPKPERMSGASFAHRIEAVQEFTRNSFGIQELRPGRYDEYELWAEKGNATASGSGDARLASIPRFTLIIVDHSTACEGAKSNTSSRISCAVFFIPQGREAHYQFCTQKGLEGIADLANCYRLIAVRCNRPHQFPSNLTLLQSELDPMIVPLLPHASVNGKLISEPEKVPYVAIPDDGGWEAVVEGSSDASGAYVIEERECDDDDDDAGAVTGKGKDSSNRGILRRLVFLGSQHFIQSEVRLAVVDTSARASTATDRSAQDDAHMAQLCASNGWCVDSLAGLAFDPLHVDDHHKAVLVGLALSPCTTSTAAAASGTGHSAIIIGLGGGAFPMVLQRYSPRTVQYTCDIDPHMLEVAVSHFGFRPQAQRSFFHGCDGITLLKNACLSVASSDSGRSAGIGISASASVPLPTEPVQLIFLDVDSKSDGSTGMTAPPAGFTTAACVEDCWGSLAPGGLLAINVVSRSDGPLRAFEQVLRSVFCRSEAAAAGKAGGGAPQGAKGGVDSTDVRDLIRGAISGNLDLDLASAPASSILSDIDIDIDEDEDEKKAGVSAPTARTPEAGVGAGAGAGAIYRLKASDDVVNQTLLCFKESSASVSDRGDLRLHPRADKRAPLDAWLRGADFADGADPLDLRGLYAKLEEIV